MKVPKMVIGILFLVGFVFYCSANGDLFFAEKIREVAQVGKLGQAVFATCIGILFWMLSAAALFHNDRLEDE